MEFTNKMKSILLGLTLAGLVVSNLLSFTSVFSDNEAYHTATTKTLILHEARLKNCEAAIHSGNLLLLEIRFNLRQHILQQGGVYLENVK